MDDHVFRLLQESKRISAADAPQFAEATISLHSIKKQSLFIVGYLRKELKQNTKVNILKNEILAFSKFPDNPSTDPANFISTEETQICETYRNFGNESFKNKKYSEAVIKYTTALTFNPNDHRIFCNRSLCYLLLNEISSANSDAIRAVKMCPTNPKNWYRLGSVSEKLNDLFTAYLAYRAAKNILQMKNSVNHNINASLLKISQKIKNDQTINHWIKSFDDGQFDQCFLLKIDSLSKRLNISPNEVQNNVEIYRLYISTIVQLFKSVQCTKCVMYQSSIKNTEQYLNHTWVVSFTSLNSIEFGKRTFLSDVICSEMGAMEVSFCFCRPTAKHIINMITKAIICGLTTQDSAQNKPYKPRYILLAHRLKKQSDVIINAMKIYGVHCYLETKEEAIKTAKEHQTDVNGYNYFDNCRSG